MAKKVFCSMAKILKNLSVGMKVRIRILKCYTYMVKVGIGMQDMDKRYRLPEENRCSINVVFENVKDAMDR